MMVTPRGSALVVLAATLAACAPQLPPPGAPTPEQVSGVAAQLQTTNVPPADYVSIGTTLATQACADWFTREVMSSQATRFGQSALSIGSGVAAAAGGPAGAGAAAGASTLSALLGAAQSSLGAGPAPAAVYSLVSRVEQAWLAAMPAPITQADAYALVEAYAAQCNLPAIQSAVAQAMMTVPVTAAVAEPAEAPSAALRDRAEPSGVRRQGRLPRKSSRTRAQQESLLPAPSTRLQVEWEQSGRPFTSRIPRVYIGKL